MSDVVMGNVADAREEMARLTAMVPVLEPALNALPDGVWETWTSNSFRRISRKGGGDGDVLSATIHPHDGHPDLTWAKDQCDAICTIVNTLRCALAERTDT